ncbi:MAG: peptidylprolyl isomerase [Ruminococcus sp.]|nr:peptidylprolyl isomerase [Ruminococcus sp.]
MLKRISAFLLAMALAVGCLASCDKDKDESSSKAKKSDSSAAATDSAAEAKAEPSLTIDGKKVKTKDLVMLTVDGHDIDFDTYRYYYLSTLANYANYGLTADALKEDDDMFKKFLEQVESTIKNDYVSDKLAEENNIKLDKKDLQVVDKNIKSTQSQYQSEEEYLEAMKSMYLTEEVFKAMMTRSQLYQKVQSTLLSNGGKYATPADEFKKVVKDTKEYSRVIHILIPYECKAPITDKEELEKYNSTDDLSTKIESKRTAFNQQTEDKQAKLKAEAKKLAEAVLKKAKSGEDFAALVKKYGWDPGMVTNPDGYYINQNTSFVQEFKDAAFSLKENEISDLVENASYGWFIIKRLPVDMDYVEENLDTMIQEYDTPKINKLYEDITSKMKVKYSDTYKKMKADSIT